MLLLFPCPIPHRTHLPLNRRENPPPHLQRSLLAPPSPHTSTSMSSASSPVRLYGASYRARSLRQETAATRRAKFPLFLSACAYFLGTRKWLIEFLHTPPLSLFLCPATDEVWFSGSQGHRAFIKTASPRINSPAS